ncbi:phosphoadenylyl-sulfate reductase [Terasakiella sp. A23]|uniref:phosphoadenylyl-sulfate reductase n=1 Tax=Terasakiella sp. FCG-A23 TaxID=3080561 RepID=UPI002952D1A9|nr:phosphoadenylyl-sulfate reductase [Terasakiella sp. A23]MDV7339400.1 phosphoadenylyl-sulfate reductase [Terasakiella sp. A23]
MSATSSAVSFTKPSASQDEGQAKLSHLLESYGTLDAHELLEKVLLEEFKGEIAVSSSFGAEAAVLLKLISDVDKETPILFIDTGHLFEETIQYKETIGEHLGLTNILTVGPEEIHLQNADKDATLYERDTDYCCHIRKVLPFEKALGPYKAWVSGRKRFQNSERAALQPIELDVDGRFKVNPLYNWDYDKVISEFKAMNLPKHPLVAKGYPSIGCAPCTRAVKDGEDQRAGRWSGQGKTECGIHKSPSFEAIYI